MNQVKIQRPLSRRTFVWSVGALAVVKSTPVLAQLAPTPAQTMGPFYPVRLPPDSDADLTRVQGRSQRALGQVIEVFGRVLDAGGAPLPGAKVEIWQANAVGRYDHPGDNNRAPLDPNFQGFGTIAADTEGRYRFRTIKPAPYSGRTAHIHYQIGAGRRQLVTQLYFPGEPNERDSVFRGLRDPASVTAKSVPLPADGEAGALAFVFDIVLGGTA